LIRFKQSGDFSNAIRYLNNASELSKSTCFDKYGKEGVAALSAATPVDTGLTANSWYYTIAYSNRGITISFNNSNISNGVPIALILQYGHATRTGGWVAGRDYINPAIQPIFDRMANEAWKEVTKL
jgi:hypothetical protein